MIGEEQRLSLQQALAAAAKGWIRAYVLNDQHRYSAFPSVETQHGLCYVQAGPHGLVVQVDGDNTVYNVNLQVEVAVLNPPDPFLADMRKSAPKTGISTGSYA